jgi:hypothetical protein
MNIGEEDEEAVEYPVPVDPAKRQAPLREPSPVTAPVTEPVKEPAHAMADPDAAVWAFLDGGGA